MKHAAKTAVYVAALVLWSAVGGYAVAIGWWLGGAERPLPFYLWFIGVAVGAWAMASWVDERIRERKERENG